MSDAGWGRRDFLRLSAQAAGALSLGEAENGPARQQVESGTTQVSDPSSDLHRLFNGAYEGRRLSHIAFPLGGIGAGMICLEGTGALSRFSLRNRPDLANEPKVFAAVSIKGSQKAARVLEGQVPDWKLCPQFPGGELGGPTPACWGLPRFRQAAFKARFPFATVHLKDDAVPLEVKLTGWSPFSPGDADNASLPVASLEYEFLNRGPAAVDAVFSFNAQNFMAEPEDPLRQNFKPLDRIRSTAGGFILYGPGAEGHPWDEGCWAAWTDDPNAKVNHAWFRGTWADSLQMVWRDVMSGECHARNPLSASSSPGASIFVPFSVAPGQTKTITLHVAWYVPKSNLYEPKLGFKDGKWMSYSNAAQTYQPWYAGRFAGIEEVIRYWQDRHRPLRQAAEKFSRAFYDSTLPPEVIESVAANLTILKSPTVLRQTDGRLWGWEGSNDSVGSCYGSSTHVWNYAQAIAHLFPDLERSLRETEFGPNQNEDGHQYSRAALPIRPMEEVHEFPDGPFGGWEAADGQLGGVIKAYREWRISGDTAWLHRLWPRIRASLDYCIRTWDPRHRGWIEEPHLTTYDVRFWGADSMCTSIYLGALQAATLMAKALNEAVNDYSELLGRGVRRMEGELFNGEYFIQRIEWRHLQTSFPTGDAWARIFPESPDGLDLARKEGPKYQYGDGCLSDGVLGAWLCLVSGLGEVFDIRKVESHLSAVRRYNLKVELADQANLKRAIFACRDESGLLLCTWPRGDEPSLPFAYANEVWTGIEYQVASHLIALGKIDEGLDIVRSCRRRYDGRLRNPFDEVESGHWYARAMSSYALLQAFSGARFDAVEKILHLRPVIKGDFRCFLSTAGGFGTVGVKNGQPFVQVVSGNIPYTKIEYTAA